MARALARRSVASYEGLISEVYGHLSNGGPRNPRNVLAVIMVRLRRKLAAHGIRVRTSRATGYRVDEADRVKLRALVEPPRPHCCPTCGQTVSVS